MVKVSVIMRLATFAAIVGAIYWYWSGPYQEKINPSYETILKKNNETMRECIHGEAYIHGATGGGISGSRAEEQCAQKYNLYKLEGNWHSHDMARPE